MSSHPNGPASLEQQMSNIDLNGRGGGRGGYDNSNEEAAVQEKSRGCKHYARGCSFVSPCCGKIFPCRVCHDEQVSGHTLDRHSVVLIVCNKCAQKQAVSNKCNACGDTFGNYFCSICRLYDDIDKQQYHCDKCGICRVGGSENYIHCDTCGCCLPKNQPHRCVPKSSQNDCPVCLEDLHSSRVACHILPCGHLLHTTCYKNLWKYNIYRCPTCSLSIADLSSHWADLDRAIRNTPMPAEYANDKVWILCNDCHKVSEVLWHVFGLKCTACGSYNTCREEAPKPSASSTSAAATNDDDDDDGGGGDSQEAGPSHHQHMEVDEDVPTTVQPEDVQTTTDNDDSSSWSDEEYESLD